MFNIIGKDCIYIDIQEVFREKLLALSAFDEKASEFGKLFEKTEVQYLLNGTTEESCFILTVPDEYSPEQIQTMADVIIRAINRFGKPPVLVDNIEQSYRINISNAHEPEIIGLRRTPGMSSLEVFKPIINGWQGPGQQNPNFDY